MGSRQSGFKTADKSIGPDGRGYGPMTIIDLTHPIHERVPVYFPWHPKTEIEKTANYKEHRCEVTRLSIGTHGGTHIDAPSHIFEGMPTIDQYNASLWYVDAQVLDFTPRNARQEITADEIRSKLKKKNVG